MKNVTDIVLINDLGSYRNDFPKLIKLLKNTKKRLFLKTKGNNRHNSGKFSKFYRNYICHN